MNDTAAAEPGTNITLLYVRPACDETTEPDRRVWAAALRYARWVELRVVRPEELTWTASGSPEIAGTPSGPGSRDVERMVGSGSPTVFLLRAGAVISEAVGAL